MADDIITVKSILNLWYGTDGKTSAANRGHHALKDINVDIPCPPDHRPHRPFRLR